ncbi:hypothetical protein FG379_001985 [Cryptosporidium bovis]|uniref:uncharacterized protein n=1 Tax=Cryptosporidium bovis TaxID=310047 RepID=UPI00351A7AED|nr:hypothetical protein FG379_001985 [Cryptosporidium bovis]
MALRLSKVNKSKTSKKNEGKKKFYPNSTMNNSNKYQLCTFFIKGRCKNGNFCQFQHSTIPITKKKLCWYFISGKCSKNFDCQYSHEISKFPCRYLNTVGFCRNLKNCRFSHTLINTDEEREQFVRDNKDYLMLPHEKGGPNELDPNHMWWKPILENVIKEQENIDAQNLLLKNLYNESESAIPKEICSVLSLVRRK